MEVSSASQNLRSADIGDWRRPSEISWPMSVLRAQPLKAGYVGLCPFGVWITSRMEILQPLWAPCATLWWSLQSKWFFLYSNWSSYVSITCLLCPLPPLLSLSIREKSLVLSFLLPPTKWIYEIQTLKIRASIYGNEDQQHYLSQ